MARLGALRGGDLRCMSATFMVIVFFCCVFMLSLQPSQYPTKLTMVDLPKDEVVRAQSIPALAPAAVSQNPNSKGSGSGKEGKKNSGKGEQKNKNDKKAIKAKWIKDELPKKLHVGHVRNNTKIWSKLEGGQDFQNKTSPEEKTPESSPLQAEPSPVKKTSNVTEPLPVKVETEEVQTPPPHVPSRPRPSFSDLNEAPVHSFESPFIESRSKTLGVEKKVITWYKAREERELHRLRKALENCPEPQCKLVYPLTIGQSADAVIFEDVYRREPPPARTHRDQVFVLHAMSPPSSSPDIPWNTAWKSMFNWTWSYRNDSDIWQPFGLLKRSKKVKPLDYFENLTKSKSHAVVWMPRTCPPTSPSHRDEFVRELSRRVHVIEYGACANKSCAKGGSLSCSDNLTKKFFFLLAAEDDLCQDHVTEVFYRAWQEKTHVLPVVHGGADYAMYFPEGTYIDTDWFDNAKQLGEFMAELVASRKIYAQLLWRKAHWVKSTKRPDEVSMCKLCHKLHSLPSNRNGYSNIQHWYEKSVCKDPKPF